MKTRFFAWFWAASALAAEGFWAVDTVTTDPAKQEWRIRIPEGEVFRVVTVLRFRSRDGTPGVAEAWFQPDWMAEAGAWLPVREGLVGFGPGVLYLRQRPGPEGNVYVAAEVLQRATAPATNSVRLTVEASEDLVRWSKVGEVSAAAPGAGQARFWRLRVGESTDGGGGQ